MVVIVIKRNGFSYEPSPVIVCKDVRYAKTESPRGLGSYGRKAQCWFVGAQPSERLSAECKDIELPQGFQEATKPYG